MFCKRRRASVAPTEDLVQLIEKVNNYEKLLRRCYGYISQLQSDNEQLHECYETVRDNVDDAFKCCVCMDKLRDVVLHPCRHLCMCSHCARKGNRCPVCLASIEVMYRVFLP